MIDHQFLLTLMLGKEYVKNNKTFERFFLSTEKDLDYLSLKESILMHVAKATSRCEIVVTGQDVMDLLRVDLTR